MPGQAPVAAPKKKLSPLVIASGALAVAVIAGVAWFLFRPKPPAPVAPPAPKPVVVAPAPKPAPAPEAPPVAAVVAEPVVESVFTPEMQERLTKLVVSARRTGAEQRIVVGGKVYLPGDAVFDGVFLEAVFPDKIVFRDEAKHRFERR